MIAAAPVIACRCCGKATDVKPQMGWKGNVLWIITCWQRNCPMSGQTSTEGDYPTLDLSLYGVFALEALNTGDVFLFDGIQSAVWRNQGGALWLQDAGHDAVYEVPYTALTEGVYVKVTARGTFALVSWAEQYIERREWRAMVGE